MSAQRSDNTRRRNDDRRRQLIGAGGGPLLSGNVQEMVLPFKPFTVEEVHAITQAPVKLIDLFVTEGYLTLKLGDSGTYALGLDYMQTFGVFAAWKWLQAGADVPRACRVLVFVANTTKEHMLLEFGKGNTFPGMVEVPNRVIGGPPEVRGLLVRPDPDVPSMKQLSLLRHFDEFLERVDRVFTPKVVV